MDIVEQYVKVSARPESRGLAPGADLVRLGAPVQNGQYQVVLRRQQERVFNPKLLPPEILNDPRFWQVTEVEAVAVLPVLEGPVFVTPEAPVPLDLLRYRC